MTLLVALAAALAALFAPPARAQTPVAPEEAPMFARIDEMRADVERILGMEAVEPIRRKLITREEINALLRGRLEEETQEEEIRQEELFLRLFGFVDEDFNLKDEIVDVLTEQAAALYDYKTKTLYLADWAPQDLQEYALVHELAHAVADQHFDLQKFVDSASDFDGDLARSAVIEGQASWVMHEYAQQLVGRSLATSQFLAASAASASRIEVEAYPVFSASPLYIRESMIFPYTDGLLFQQAAVRALGGKAFGRVFEDPPSTTRHILYPETWLDHATPSDPELPRLDLDGFEVSSEGRVGQLDHRILLRQYGGRRDAERTAKSWRGGGYEIHENPERSRAVLRYASDWATPEAAKRFFRGYVQVCHKKWMSFEGHDCGETSCRGRSETGRFLIRLEGARVSSLEGLPDDTAGLETVAGGE